MAHLDLTDLEMWAIEKDGQCQEAIWTWVAGRTRRDLAYLCNKAASLTGMSRRLDQENKLRAQVSAGVERVLRGGNGSWAVCREVEYILRDFGYGWTRREPFAVREIPRRTTRPSVFSTSLARAVNWSTEGGRRRDPRNVASEDYFWNGNVPI